MTTINEVIEEIHRHKGVLLPNDHDLRNFSQELFYGACELLGCKRREVRHLVDDFVLNKYQQVLAHTMHCYEEFPDKREFYFRAKWDDLPKLQEQLVGQYREKLE